jgi:hypothetical protein
MRHILDMNPSGHFTLTEDPEDTISTAVSIALAPQHGEMWRTALQPNGEGMQIQGVGMISRAYDRENLPFEFQDDPAFDPKTQELWRIRRERSRDVPDGSWGVITGDELRHLVQLGSEMRAQRK